VISAATSSDLLPPQLAFGPDGLASVGFGLIDEVDPARYAALVAPGNGLVTNAFARPLRLPGAEQLLGLAYLPVSARRSKPRRSKQASRTGVTPPQVPALELLSGTSPSDLSCCTAVEVRSLSAAGALGPARTIIKGLDGPTSGQLLPLPRGPLAVVASVNGLWVARASAGGRFGAARMLSYSQDDEPPVIATSGLSGGRSVVAWTAVVPGQTPPAAPQQIFYALGSARGVPTVARLVLTLPAGFSVQNLAVAPRGSGATLAWVESWYDAAGTFHSQAFAADLTAHPMPVAVSAPGVLATGASLSADTRGDQAMTWQGCDAAGSCTADLALRPARGDWSATQTLGTLDSTDLPAVAESSGGKVLVAWVSQGQVWDAEAAPTRLLRSSRRLASAGSSAAGVALGFSATGDALAAWTQGLATESVDGARFDG